MVVTASRLMLLFADCNIEYFDSELPLPEFKVNNSYKTLGMYSTYPTDDGHYGDVIEISGNYDFTESQVKDIMVHEMIHMYLMHFGIDKSCTHGKEFKKMMMDFNIRYGLNVDIRTDVTKFKVRKGKSDFMKRLCSLF